MACEFENECDEDSSNDFWQRGNATMKIWRTKSLDDVHPIFQSGTGSTVAVEKVADSTRSLHSSFDAALLLDSNVRTGEWFDPGQRRTVAYSNQIRSEFSGRKHMRQKFQMNFAERSMAETFRKQARTDISLAEPSQQLKFQIYTSTSKGSSSFSKRRRIPSQTFRSSTPKSGTIIAESNTTGANQASNTNKWSLSPKKRSGNLTPQNHCRTRSKMLHLATLSKVHSTGTKTASTAALETTEEFDSCELPPPSMEPFRFPSFPESVPRLSNPVERHYPESICRRMSSGERNGINILRLSRENDVTHGTSICSLSADGYRHYPICIAPSHKDLAIASSQIRNGVLEPSTPFPRCAGFGKSISSNDSTPTSPGSRAVGAMRLDFNVYLSPTQMICDSPRTSSGT